ncbi:LysM peptidoglycan-binding domain-containing protein [Methylorubrum populi]
MTAEMRRSILLAAVGLLGGFAMVVALFGTGELLKRNAAVNPSAETPAAPKSLSAGTETGDRAGATASTEPPHAAPGGPSQGETGQADRSAPGAPKAEAGDAPTFDIVRVEPDGASVIAGRAAPRARIDLLRDGKPFATVSADDAGQFALTPPDLPAGSSEIVLRATGADGKPITGRESVTVVVAERRDAKPLIALSTPDQPTQVLSQPDAPGSTGKAVTAFAEAPGQAGPRPEAAAPPGAGGKPAGKTAAGNTTSEKTVSGKTEPGKEPIRIVSVDAQEGGRLHVTSQAAAGSALRLYLNDTLVASGRSGPDGRLAFTIGRGVKPGPYKIRVDAVEASGSKVKSRAEVAFTYPDGTPPTRLAESATVGGSPPGVAPKPPGPARAATSGQGGSAGASTPAAAGSEAAQPGTNLATAPPRPERRPEPDRTASSGTAPGATSQGSEERTASVTPGRPEAGAAAPGTAAGTAYVPEVSTARITRGDSLWQISRRIYGKGNRYTVIYDANQEQIRDPDLIYPGQMFVLPKDNPAAAAPAAKAGPDRRT